MVLGKDNILEIVRDTEPGLYLKDEEGNEVLLPNRYVPEEFEIGDTIEVFVYLDNEERVIATTDEPYIYKGDFGLLRCNQVNEFGAFLDWGLVKELFCPFKEQASKMRVGSWYLVYCYLDEKSGRLAASSKTNKFLDETEITVEPFEEVDLIVSHPSELGMNVIINKKHLGLVFEEDIFRDLSIGDELKGFIKRIRPDKKITVVLDRMGYRSIEPNADKIMQRLQDNNGTLRLTDKSSPDEIKDILQMSKKSFKKAIGTLYKKRLITISDKEIKLK